jgi:hypothetical protein
MDEKHDHYQDQHVPDEIFWGIGIENETYIELTEGQFVAADFLLRNRGRERYSVDYWTTYKTGVAEQALQTWIRSLPRGSDTVLHLPILWNGHRLTRCDRHGEHRTTYTRVPVPNARFGGTTLAEDLAAIKPAVFGEPHPWWCYDGDTVEFVTQRFRNTTIEVCLEELVALKTEWMSAFREGLQQLGLPHTPRWPLKNYGFAVFATNPRNVAIFNNGTYHINLTAPTRMDKDTQIADWGRFVAVHCAAARLFQWLSPLLVARYGSPDWGAAGGTEGKGSQGGTLGALRFPAGSQRIAASRYVSLGTYDTRTMRTGKILTEPREAVGTAGWHKAALAREGCAYAPLEMIGFDVNFAKYRNHGLELRIFDWFPEEELLDVLRLCVWMLDEAVSRVDRGDTVPVPQESPEWEAVAERGVWEGAGGWMTAQELAVFRGALGNDMSGLCGDASGSLGMVGALDRVFGGWAAKWGCRGPCGRRMMATAPLAFIPVVPTEHMGEEAGSGRDVGNTVIVRLVKRLPWRPKATAMVTVAHVGCFVPSWWSLLFKK